MNARKSRILRVGLVPISWLCASSALATPPPQGVALEWIAPPECPDEASAKRIIEGYLGNRPLGAFKSLAVHVEISSLPGGRFRGDLTFGGAAFGNRRFEGSSCARVSEAAALIVALMLDPVEVATQIELPRAPVAVRAPDENGPVERSSQPESLHAALGLHTAGDVGSLPAPTVGAGLFARLDWPRASLAIDFTSWVPRRILRGPTPESGGELGLYAASVRGCFVPSATPLAGIQLDVCARAETGVATGSGFGIAEPRSSQAPWAAAFVGLTIRPATRAALGVWLSVEGGVAVSRPRFSIEDFGRVFEASTVLGRALLGVAWTFP